MKAVKRWIKMMPETNQYECCSCDRMMGKLVREESSFRVSYSFDDMLCEDVIVIICSFLGAEELWNNTRRVNMSFRNQTMKDRLWKELYHLRWGDLSESQCVYHQMIKESVPWWQIYMQRHLWLSFEFNSLDRKCPTLNVMNDLFTTSVKCLDSGLAFYERLHSLGKVASECGLYLISQQQEQCKNNKPQAYQNSSYPHSAPRSSIEECVIFCKLFLKAYYGKAESQIQAAPNRFFSALLNLQVIFLLVQSYSIIGEYDKTIVYSTECLDCIYNIKQLYASESTTSDEHIMSKIEEKSLFYRGYSSHKLGLFDQAERDLVLAESLYSVSSCCSTIKEEECSLEGNASNHSKKYYHLMNIQFTLINNHIKLKQYQESLEYFMKLISLMNSVTATNSQSPRKSPTTIESISEKSWNLLNSWFPGLPYFFLAEFLFKQQNLMASKILFEKYSNYEQGRKLSVHNKLTKPTTNPSKDKQLVHAMHRINQINSVIQSDQEY